MGRDVLSDYTKKGVERRVKDLTGTPEAQMVLQRMERMQKYATMQVWGDRKRDSEKQVVMPTAVSLLNKVSAAYLAVAPVIDVKADGDDENSMEREQKVEQYLWAVKSATRLDMHREVQEKSAQTVGVGWLKGRLDLDAVEGEFPIKVSVCNPATTWADFNLETGEPQCLVQSWKRKRREVLDDWPDFVFKDKVEPKDEDQRATWLEDEVVYTELWELRRVKESVEETTDVSSEMSDEDDEEEGTVGQSSKLQVQSSKESGEEAATSDTKKGKAKKGEYVRKVAHMVMVGEGDNAEWVKKPVWCKGYPFIPFFYVYGETLVIDGKRQGVSALYAVAGGDAGGDKTNVLQIRNLLMSQMLETASNAAGRSAWWTDDIKFQDQKSLDMEPGTLHVGSTGAQKPQPLIPEGNMQIAAQVLKEVSDSIYGDLIPEVLSGRQFNLSGTAVEGMSESWTWKLALRQQHESNELQRFFHWVLHVTKMYAAESEDGWTVTGIGKHNKYVKAKITADDINLNDRVVVKLSSSMPKDKAAHLSMGIKMNEMGMMTAEELVEERQKLYGDSSLSPSEVLEKTAVERIVMRSGLLEQIGKELMQAEQGRYAETLKQAAADYVAQIFKKYVPEVPPVVGNQMSLDTSQMPPAPQMPPVGMGAPMPQEPPVISSQMPVGSGQMAVPPAPQTPAEQAQILNLLGG